MNYKQSVYTIQLKYIEDDFEYVIDSFSGEREENIITTKLNICKSLFDELQLKISTPYLVNLKDILRSFKKDLEKHEIRFSAFMSLHNEKVLIDNVKEDNRSYGLLRLIFKDIDNNMNVDDISILSCDQDDVEDKINYYVKKNINIRYPQGTRTYVDFGRTPTILSPRASGYFIHEILGHTLEGDYYSYYKDKYANMKISEKLTVIDSVDGFSKLIGIQDYDDIGIKLKPLTLIKQGKLHNILATKNEDSLDNKLYGVARRESYKFDILPRMRGTYIQPIDDMDQQEILNKYENAIFVDETFSGGVDQQTGNYSLIGNGFVIKNGDKQNFIGNLRITGNIIKDLSSFDYIGKDFDMFGSYCRKFGQSVRVGLGGPTVSISSLAVKGDLYGRR
ncbi:MAG: metallopeptidase TldD-related protein [Anaerocolumna sp.]